MAASKQAFYLDNQRSAQIRETIAKENKILLAYYKKAEEDGLIQPYDPAADDSSVAARPTMKETLGPAPHLETVRQDPELSAMTTLSKRLSASTNPGFIVRDGAGMSSAMQSDYVWDEESIAFMKEQGEFDKANNRKRDDFVLYAEALARATKLAKAK